MIVYVERNEANQIKGVYRQPQPGYAEEQADMLDSEVVAFFNSIEPQA